MGVKFVLTWKLLHGVTGAAQVFETYSTRTRPFTAEFGRDSRQSIDHIDIKSNGCPMSPDAVLKPISPSVLGVNVRTMVEACHHSSADDHRTAQGENKTERRDEGNKRNIPAGMILL
mmetsp:Transcript_25485/g.35038  ORF Transcript_25485/g.35038 Transcript_25485/m.35038 type:complete len:117 (-) Transcript_25485:354-704(-)